VLKNGDKLILYYGDYQATEIPNKLSFSTQLPDKKLEITLQNEAFDWNTNKNVISDITDAKVNIDGKEYVVDGNKVTIGSGLPAGQHILERIL
jgi:hypothetical protein